MKISPNNYNEQGFTLVEVIMGMTLMIIIMTAILSLFGVSIRSQQFSVGRVGDIQQSRLAINTIADEIRYAKNITPPASPFQTLQYTDAQDNNNILSFNPTDKKIYVKYGNASPKAITSSVFTMLQFMPDAQDPKLIIIKMKLKDTKTQEILETEVMVRLLN